MQLKITYKENCGFTIMEIMVVSILIAIIAGFALPNFSRSIQKAHVRDAMSQLSAIYAANMIYQAQNKKFLNASAIDINGINTNLSLNLVSNNMTYSYTGDNTTFTATATPISGTAYTVRVNQSAINPKPEGTTGGNPCCSSGSCPGLGNC